MCGIVGIVGGTARGDRALIEGLAGQLLHRGPDDRGAEVLDGGRVLMGHTRLSILDLTAAGHQPMSADDGRFWIVYNGEIYNYRDIRRELEGRGVRFSSHTDTEVLLYAYREWGAGCLERLNGMFAFAVYDRRDGSVLLVRDRLGIKPLYYTVQGDRLAFASEAKALLELPGVRREVRWDAVLSHQVFMWAPGPETAFEGIFKLQPGHWLRWRDSRCEVRCYWNAPTDAAFENRTEAECLEELDGLVHRAVERRMVSDVPVGAFLSGGLDSSLIVALMRRFSGAPFRTYSIVFDEADKAFEAMPDDQKYARVAAQALDTDHQEVLIRPDIADLLPRMVWHLDEPVADPAAINTYLICKAAKESGTTVMLSGMGADEIFGGYRRYLSVLLAQVYRRVVPGPLRDGVVRPVLDALPVASRSGGFRLFRWARRFAKSASLDDLGCFIGNASFCSAEELNALLHPDLRVEWESLGAIRKHRACFEEAAGRDLLTRMNYTDTKLYLPDHNLLYSDKASMAASVEERVPFADHEMVGFALRLPSEYRVRGKTQKYLLKKLAIRYLPAEIVYRPKAPFGAPLRAWMHRGLGPLVDGLLSEASVRRRGYFRYEAVRKIIEDNRSGRHDYGHRLWALVTLELWHRIFIDREMHPSQGSAEDVVQDVSRCAGRRPL